MCRIRLTSVSNEDQDNMTELKEPKELTMTPDDNELPLYDGSFKSPTMSTSCCPETPEHNDIPANNCLSLLTTTTTTLKTPYYSPSSSHRHHDTTGSPRCRRRHKRSTFQFHGQDLTMADFFGCLLMANNNKNDKKKAGATIATTTTTTTTRRSPNETSPRRHKRNYALIDYSNTFLPNLHNNHDYADGYDNDYNIISPTTAMTRAIITSE